MKTFLAFMAAFVLVATTERPAQAAHQTIRVEVFYDALAPYGDWVEVEGYGYCFRPTVSLEDPEWKPYTEGSWIYTDAGWTWDSDEDFGWATFHYGRWFLLSGAWFWVPGETWGPAWVSWRTGDEYVGWAPLPPEAIWKSDTGFGIYVDADFNIGPAYYSFLPVQYLGHQHVRRWIEPWRRNVEFVRLTENRTRITHRITENHLTAVFNDGPDFTIMSRRTEQPIRRLTLAEQESVDLRDRKARRQNTVQNDRFRVIAPDVDRAADRDVAPPKVTHRFDRSKVSRGWDGFREDEVRELRARMAATGRNANRVANRESRTAERAPKAQPAEPQTTPSEERAGKPRHTTPATAGRTPKAPRTDPTATPAGKDERSGIRAESEPLRKVEPPQAGRDAEERTRIRPDEAADIRKAVPVVPGPEQAPKGRTRPSEEQPGKSKGKGENQTPTPGRDEDERTRVRPGEDQPRRPQTPADDLRPGVPERFRNEPQDAPPRPPTAPRPGVNQTLDKPPGPTRGVVPDSGNSQRLRPGSANLPRSNSDRGVRDERAAPGGTPPRISPNVAPLAPVEPQNLEPRKIIPPSHQPPRATPKLDKPRSTPPSGITGKAPGGERNPRDDDEKKRPR